MEILKLIVAMESGLFEEERTRGIMIKQVLLMLITLIGLFEVQVVLCESFWYQIIELPDMGASLNTFSADHVTLGCPSVVTLATCLTSS
jgi:hypothetical protein